jgi:hypothetical protein
MMSCEPEVVLMKEGFILTRCNHCNRIGMMHRQFMISFGPLDFDAFCRYVERLDFQDHACPFFDDVDRMVIETYHMDIQFTLTEEEFYRFKGHIEEARFQLQLYLLLKD